MLGNCPLGFLWRGEGGGGVLLSILSFVLCFLMRDVWVPLGGDGGLLGGEGMCYTWSRAR